MADDLSDMFVRNFERTLPSVAPELYLKKKDYLLDDDDWEEITETSMNGNVAITYRVPTYTSSKYEFPVTRRDIPINLGGL